MAPEVAVPANFGKHHLKSRTHNNLELLCAEGEVQRANSMILSLNSSVIEDLIARLEITSLDMQDFAAPAVNCFVESMYCGELENCDKTNFRDLNKMGHVFDVTWFVERCLKYFTELLDQVTGRSYEDILFVAEEAWFVEENLKKCQLMDLVVDKIDQLGNAKSVFLKEYAGDLDKMSINQVNMVVKIGGKDCGILASVLYNHLQKRSASTLSDPASYLLENVDFVQCFINKRYFDVASGLLSKILNESCNKEFKSAVKCIANFSKPKVTRNVNKFVTFPVTVDLPIKDFLELDWDSLLNFLASSDSICNIYQFFDTIYMWLFGSNMDSMTKIPRIGTAGSDVVKNIIDIKCDRFWGKVSRTFLNLLTASNNIGIDRLINLFVNSDELSFNGENIIFRSEQDYSVDKMFQRSENFDIELLLEEGIKMSACPKESRCGILLNRSFEGNENDFLLKLSSTESGRADVHYHDVLGSSQIASLVMEVGSHDHVGKAVMTSIPFNCVPCLDSSGYWYWGFHEFGGKRQYRRKQCRFSYGHDPNSKIKFYAILT